MDEIKMKDIIFGILIVTVFFLLFFVLGFFYSDYINENKEQKNCYFLEYNYLTILPIDPTTNTSKYSEAVIKEHNKKFYNIISYDVHNETELYDKLRSFAYRNLTVNITEISIADCNFRNRGKGNEFLEVGRDKKIGNSSILSATDSSNNKRGYGAYDYRAESDKYYN